MLILKLTFGHLHLHGNVITVIIFHSHIRNVKKNMGGDIAMSCIRGNT